MLQPCERCHRHVSAAEASCPFCGQPITRTPSNVRRVVAQLSRAAIFAGASACWTSAAPATTTSGGSATENRTGLGSIGGRVYQDNVPVAGIPVFLEGADGSVRETISGPDGTYNFADVPAGQYHATTRTAPTARRRYRGDEPPEKPPYQNSLYAYGPRLMAVTDKLDCRP